MAAAKGPGTGIADSRRTCVCTVHWITLAIAAGKRDFFPPITEVALG
jgi:hypothetical protein